MRVQKHPCARCKKLPCTCPRYRLDVYYGYDRYGRPRFTKDRYFDKRSAAMIVAKRPYTIGGFSEGSVGWTLRDLKTGETLYERWAK